MKKLLVSLLVVASLFLAAAPAEAKTAICANGSICFADLHGGVSTDSRSGTVPRNTCINLTHPNTASRIDNETGVQWKVFLGWGCSDTPVGIIYAHTDGEMAAPYDNSISSVVRTSTP